MTNSRLSLALEQGLFEFPAGGGVVVWGASADHDLSMLPASTTVVAFSRPDADALEVAGFAVGTSAPETAALGIVLLPRSKAEARGLIAEATRLTRGPVVIDGQKTDGVEGILRDLKARGTLGPVLSKAHGKLAVLSQGADCGSWDVAGPSRNADGYLTCPGIFSADGIDPGSLLLAAALPAKLGRRVADLGAGWGYLSAQGLSRDSIEEMHLVEADFRALECARQNIVDPRAAFHWADALSFEGASQLDTVLANPPFHKGRTGDPGIGQGFIQAAARLLKPGGQLWLVANRHLPYERGLNAAFGEVAEIGGDRSYKLFRAARPLRKGARR